MTAVLPISLIAFNNSPCSGKSVIDKSDEGSERIPNTDVFNR